MPQLRTFSAYTKNANAGLSLIARQCALSNIDGNYIAGAAGQYFQIHDKATAPVNTDVPVKSFLLASAGPINLPSIFQILGPINLVNGLAVAISSTEATLTLGTGSFDVFGEIEEYELPISELSSFSTTDASCEIWVSDAGPKHLYDLTITNAEGYTVYPMIFGVDAASSAAATGQRPLTELPAIANGATAKFSFGSGGLSPMQKDLAKVDKKAGLIWLSTTAGLLTQSAVALSTISGHYKV